MDIHILLNIFSEMQEYDSYTDISVTRARLSSPELVQLVWYERALRCASIYLG